MDLFIFAEHDELLDIAKPLFDDIAKWAEPKTTITAIYRTDETEEAPVADREADVGIEFSITKPEKLKGTLNALYQMAKTHKCDFVVGVKEEGEYQNVCYFGNEEGRPDMYEISAYLGFE
jgi:hypothetical protein